MAFLLFLNGPRADDAVELDPSATLTLGSSPEAHVQVPDADAAPAHAQVYPAEGRVWLQDFGQGYTYLNLEPLASATVALEPHDVLIVGRTFLKFVTQPPRARGADRASELTGAKREIERLRLRLTEAHGDLARARKETAKVEEELESARATLIAQRELSDRLTEPGFDRVVELDPIEDELRALRARAAALATSLAVASNRGCP